MLPTWQQLEEWVPRLLTGLRFTVELTVLSFALAVVLGLIVALMRLDSTKRLLYIPSTIYVEVLRGTPLILQLFFAYFALPSMGIALSPLMAGVLGLGVNTSAYLSEVFRSSVANVDHGQWEATHALGMSWPVTMRYAILPQALRLAVPPTGNYAVSMFKDSALAATVSVSELLFTAQLIGSETFAYMQVYIVIGVMYLIVSYPTSVLVRRLERRLDLQRPVSSKRRPRKRVLSSVGTS